MKRRGTDAAEPTGTGPRIAALRLERGLSRAQLARSSKLGRREIAAFEEGRTTATASDLDALAEALGVSTTELTNPAPDIALVASAVSSPTGAIHGDAALDALLREYLSMVFELRRVPEITPGSLRQDDLSELARALGGTPEAIEARLIDLLGTDSAGASAMREAMLPSFSS